LLERYEDRWDWGELSKNEALPWSFELVEIFECRWTWHGGGLSANQALQWSIELIERFADLWTWGWVSENKGLPWSIELVESFADRWNWGSISANEALFLPMLRTASIVEIMAYHFDCKDTRSEMGSEAGHCTDRQSEPETHLQATNVREGRLEADHSKIVHIDMYTPLYKRLRSWRALTARARNASPSAIFQDATLREITTRRPRCLEDLTGITGLSDEDRGGYGAAILEVVTLPLYEVLRVWRAQAVKAYGIPAYEIFHDATLHKIATGRPRNLADLERVPGIGLRKRNSYGAAILELVNTSREIGEQPEGAVVPCKDDENESIPF